MQVKFVWQGIDLDVSILTPEGKPSLTSKIPVRASGTPDITIIAEVSGHYILEVRPSENLNVTGRYAMTLLAIRSPTPADQARASALKLLADANRQTLDETAIGKYLEALSRYREAADVFGEACTLRQLGRRQASLKDLPAAEKTYRLAIELTEKLNDAPTLAYGLRDIGSDYRDFDSPQKALVYYQRALQIFRDVGDRRGEAAALYSNGFAEARIGHMQVATKWYEQALVLYRVLNDRLNEAKTLLAIGGAYGVLADQDLALSFYQQAAPIWLELNDRYREAITIKNIGVVYDDWGDLQTAKDKYLAALSLFKLQLTTKDLDSCKGKIATADTSLCRSIANTLDNVGELYNTLGESQSALSTLRDGLSIRESLKQPQGIGATLSRIAYANLLQNEPTEALKYCDLALPYSRKAEDLRKVGSILTFIGMGKAALNQPDEALEYYRQALSLQETTGELRGKGITLDQMGRAYALKKDIERARESYVGALTIWQNIKDQEWEPRSIYNLAKVEQERGDLTSAQQHIENAIKIVESRRGALNNLQLRTSYFANKEDIYKLDVDLKMQLGKVTNDDRYVAAALETSDKARARTLVDTLSVANLSRAMADGSKARNPRLAELEARRQVVQGLLNAKGKSQINVLGGEHTQAKAEAINKEIDMLINEYDGLVDQITAINPRYASLTRPAALSAAEIQQQLDDETLLLEYALGDKRSYVWVVSRTSIHGFQLSGKGEIEAAAHRVTESLTQRNRELKSESFAQKLARWDKADQDFPEAAAALSKLVLDPVAAQLGRKRVVVVADGALQMIPFAALPSLAGSRTAESIRQSSTVATTVAAGPLPLITEHEITSLPSASVLALQRRELANRKPARLAVAVIADPVFDNQDERVARSIGNGNQHRKGVARTKSDIVPQPKQTIPGAPATSVSTDEHAALASALRDVGFDAEGKLRRLSFSLQEAKAILRAAPATQSFSAFDFRASRATAVSAELSQYRIIHFATHGVMDLQHPELSGIVLSMIDEKGQPVNGYLRLNEIYNLNLPAELVVLSACQTGVGKQVKGEGLIALTRGFMYAGAKSVVASLWKVDDSATSALMAEFYRQMFTNQLKPAAALRAAQREIAKQKRWQSPYFWAGFFLQGDWN
jgi:CHAT domain-containing protein